MEEEKIRLFVGGLSSDVSAGDLKERFAPLGSVQSITLPPGKAGPGHRGFAYVDFVPATDASLRKLFSAYNGCKWRGGFLRIEKAKEHFTDRLQREWAVETASLIADPPARECEVFQESSLISGRQKQDNGGNKVDLEASGLKIFFPRVRKLKHVPLTGLGKHKRSFQRVESSPLQLLLTCACEESSRSGSCDCSNINSGNSSLKDEMKYEKDDIAQAIEVERQRQLELLGRLFPVDATAIRHIGTAGNVQPDEDNVDRSSVPGPTSNEDEDRPSVQVQGFQDDQSKLSTPTKLQTGAVNNGRKPEETSISRQKLTRAAWKSLVGETGRVVFSLRQVTGSSLPQAPTLTQETRFVEDTSTQMEPILCSKTLNQNQTKPKSAVSATERKHVGVRSPGECKMNAAECTYMPMTSAICSSSEMCHFMKSDNAENEWLATKSELRSDYRAKQKSAARSVKKLCGKR